MPRPNLEQFDLSWRAVLGREFSEPYYTELMQFVDAERQIARVFPPNEDVFNAILNLPLNQVRAVIVGQDPYHDVGQAHGLAFSVRRGVKPPPSLRNILRELQDDLGHPPPDHGCLESWARAGVLLLNDVLTVRAHEAGSHQRRGWEQFTDALLAEVDNQTRPIAFLLWGNPAKKKGRLIDRSRHIVVETAHPSPLSASRGFFGSRPFSRINATLRERGCQEIDWRIE